MAFLRSRLDSQTKAELATLLGGTVRPLATGKSTLGVVVGLTDRLAFRRADGWGQILWHQIERGGWNVKNRQLHWLTTEATTDELELIEPGNLPQLFKERVNATIACSEDVPLRSGGSAIISARRNLAEPNAPLIWRVSPGASTSAEKANADPGVAADLLRLRTEFDRR